MEQVPGRPSKLNACSGSKLPYREAKKLSISILVISLPVLYVSLLHIPLSSLLEDSTFWFLMFNSIIIIVAAESGMFSPSITAEDLYVEFFNYNMAGSAVDPPSKHFSDVGDQEKKKETNREQDQAPMNAQNQSLVVVDKSAVVHETPTKENAVTKPVEERTERREDKALVLHKKSLSQVERFTDHKREAGVKMNRLRRAVTEKKKDCDDGSEMSEYEKLSDEELNKRVEEFITRLNREIRLQLRNDE